MTAEELLEERMHKLFSFESDKQDKDVQMLTHEYIEGLLQNYVTRDEENYRAGERLPIDEWKLSTAGADVRREIEGDLEKVRRDYLDSRARALRSKNGRGSGYGEYAAAARKKAYEKALADASLALAESYDEFYADLEKAEKAKEKSASFDQRLSVINYLISNRMNEREGLIYGLGAGLSYEEATALAKSASTLGKMLEDRYEYYGKDLYGDEIIN